jgi:hypothetical protein
MRLIPSVWGTLRCIRGYWSIVIRIREVDGSRGQKSKVLCLFGMCASELLVLGCVPGIFILCLAGPLALAQNDTTESIEAPNAVS